MNTVKNYYVWRKQAFERGELDNHARVDAFDPEVAGAKEAFAAAITSYCEQPDHDYRTCQDYVEVCLYVSEWPDGRDSEVYWYRVDVQMVRHTEKEQA